MATLISAKPRGKFRPCRSDLPKRVVIYANPNGGLEAQCLPYGEKPNGWALKGGSMHVEKTCQDYALRSGVGVARHLRRFPVLIIPSAKLKDDPKRMARICKLVAAEFPESGKAKIQFDARVRVVMWVADALKLRDMLCASCKVEW